MKYYYHPASPNCRKTTAVIHHVGLDAEHILVDLPKGEQMSAEFLAVNPNGKVPSLVDSDRKIWESNAIIVHLAEKTASDLWPSDDRRLDILKWMFWEQGHLMYATGVPFFQMIIKPFLGEQPDQKRVDEAYNSLRPLPSASMTRASQNEPSSTTVHAGDPARAPGKTTIPDR